MTFCSKCGNEETSDKSFCSKCGTKLTIAENDTPRSSPEDFIKKYCGQIGKDRIVEIDIAGIGDEVKLFSIWEKLDKRKELSADELDYFMVCSEELDKKGIGSSSTRKKSSDNKSKEDVPTSDPKKTSSSWFGDDPKSGMYVKGEDGFFGSKNVNERKKIIGVLVLAMFVLMMGAFAMWVFDDSDAPQQKANLEQQTDAFLIAKMELDNYLQSLDKATLQCNKIPNSVSIKGLIMDEASKIVTDAALMILIIDEAPIDSGLLPYKQRIIAAVDGLTECINRH